MSSTAKTGRKLLLVGWDGADRKLITPLLDRGRMPALNALIERGVVGPLSTLAPLLSPLLWTSLATGKRADKHGVLLSETPDAETGRMQPISAPMRRTPAIWDLLAHQGLKVHVINWYASHPAPAHCGVFVSDAYARVAAPHDEPWPLEPGTVSPARLEPILADLRVHPGDLCGEHLLPFLAGLEQIDQKRDARVAELAAIVAESTTVQAAATWVLEHEPWDCVAVHYGGLEQLGNQFLRYAPPRLPDLPERDFELYRDVVETGYCFHDLMLARLLELAGDDATVMLVSDHGFCTGEFRPPAQRFEPVGAWHRGRGIFCLAGAGLRSDALVHQAGLLDIAPTILTLFDLPVGSDMEGKPLLAAWEGAVVVRQVASWDAIVTHPPRVSVLDDALSPPSPQDNALAELRAQGYTDTPSPGFEQLVRVAEISERFHLALVQLDAGRPQQAAELLRHLHDEQPANAAITLYLAYCHYRLGDLPLCRELAATIGEGHEDHPLKELLSAMILIAEGRAKDVLECLETARLTSRREPLIFCEMGRAYQQLGCLAEAERAYERAVAIDDDCLEAHFGRALVFLAQGRWEELADAALTVVGLDHHQRLAHYLLGVALVRMGQSLRAIQAFEIALSLGPDWPDVRRWLARLRERVAQNPPPICKEQFARLYHH